LWRLVEQAVPETEVPRVVHRAVGKVTDAIERLQFNNAVAALMEVVNDGDAPRDRASLAVLVKLLAPLAPYVAEELWAKLGQRYSVHRQPWPVAGAGAVDEQADTHVVVQVDGRVRARVVVPAGRRVVRIVHVPGRLVNLVTEEEPP
jgi:leucyl-tRNA synthetase